jgi:hypothetical protein
MKKIVCVLTISATLLFGFLPLASQAKEKPKHKESGIIGQVEEFPGPWNIHIVSKKGKLLENIQANDSGYFEVELKPGTYVLTPYFTSIDGTGELVGASTTVIVYKKEFTSADLPILNGPE